MMRSGKKLISLTLAAILAAGMTAGCSTGTSSTKSGDDNSGAKKNVYADIWQSPKRTSYFGIVQELARSLKERDWDQD